MKEFTSLDLEISGGLAIIYLNQPSSLNTINSQMLKDLNQAMDLIEADDNIQVLLMTGRGKAFMAGGDIKEMVGLTSQEAESFIDEGHATMNRLSQLKLATIAVTNGFALGGGLELALTFDLRIAGYKSKFGFPEVGLGIMPGYGGTQRSSRLLGKSLAKRLIYTGEIISGEEAYRIGLVDYLVEDDQLMDEAEKIAKLILQKAPLAIQKAKEAINQGSQWLELEGLKLEADLVKELFASQDKQEGMAAFIEKRQPNFKGK